MQIAHSPSLMPYKLSKEDLTPAYALTGKMKSVKMLNEIKPYKYLTEIQIIAPPVALENPKLPYRKGLRHNGQHGSRGQGMGMSFRGDGV